ncbi:MAG: hypothetical protein GC208_06725 [Alphaproteobacteria bacterium]|nr:hypothetical protein [Alphaproteobacteria bacterium]
MSHPDEEKLLTAAAVLLLRPEYVAAIQAAQFEGDAAFARDVSLEIIRLTIFEGDKEEISSRFDALFKRVTEAETDIEDRDVMKLVILLARKRLFDNELSEYMKKHAGRMKPDVKNCHKSLAAAVLALDPDLYRKISNY